MAFVLSYAHHDRGLTELSILTSEGHASQHALLFFKYVDV